MKFLSLSLMLLYCSSVFCAAEDHTYRKIGFSFPESDRRMPTHLEVTRTQALGRALTDDTDDTSNQKLKELNRLVEEEIKHRAYDFVSFCIKEKDSLKFLSLFLNRISVLYEKRKDLRGGIEKYILELSSEFFKLEVFKGAYTEIGIKEIGYFFIFRFPFLSLKAKENFSEVLKIIVSIFRENLEKNYKKSQEFLKLLFNSAPNKVAFDPILNALENLYREKNQKDQLKRSLLVFLISTLLILNDSDLEGRSNYCMEQILESFIPDFLDQADNEDFVNLVSKNRDSFPFEFALLFQSAEEVARIIQEQKLKDSNFSNLYLFLKPQNIGRMYSKLQKVLRILENRQETLTEEEKKIMQILQEGGISTAPDIPGVILVHSPVKPDSKSSKNSPGLFERLFGGRGIGGLGSFPLAFISR